MGAVHEIQRVTPIPATLPQKAPEKISATLIYDIDPAEAYFDDQFSMAIYPKSLQPSGIWEDTWK